MAWNSYYVTSSGEWSKSKKFETIQDFYNYAAKHPSACFVASTSEFDPIGRAHSDYIEENNKFKDYKKENKES